MGMQRDAELPLVMIVEDDGFLLDGIVDMLRISGTCRVKGAKDGQEAAKILQQEIPALIISDLIMPEMNGFELLQWVRAEPRLATVPFIMLSARNQDADIKTSMALGANDYVVKPFTPDGLIELVRQVLNGS